MLLNGIYSLTPAYLTPFPCLHLKCWMAVGAPCRNCGSSPVAMVCGLHNSLRQSLATHFESVAQPTCSFSELTHSLSWFKADGCLIHSCCTGTNARRSSLYSLASPFTPIPLF